ncbi:retrovirus-related Pol polyprotein from transposon 297 [Trichonephila clavipes]|uniref:RNA-directed DNA polymerase n=1 Tax=Trichonephila clavipes TaxID=2585209 RepID=A0A8X6T235_TRICX|nr:retrovirus-related Pol polyprotein from transposon 297 [Trichonephila clavipes]
MTSSWVQDVFDISRCAQDFMQRAGMMFKKWVSNDSSLIQIWIREGFDTQSSSNISLGSHLIKVFGIAWNMIQDCLNIGIKSLLEFLKSEWLRRSPAQLKVQTILDFPVPRTKTQVRAFLGIAGYYRQYIPMFLSLAAPLKELLKGKQKKGYINWTSKCQESFVQLKEKLSTNPVLYARFQKGNLFFTPTPLTRRKEEFAANVVPAPFDDVGDQKRMVLLPEEVGEECFLESSPPTFRDGLV